MFSRSQALAIVSILLSITTTNAADGVLTGVPRFAVHVSVDGTTNRTEIEKMIAKANYKLLKASRVPTADANPKIENETNPFFHWKLGIRELDAGQLICYGSVYVKVVTQNPYNGTRMHGVLSHGYEFDVVGDKNEVDEFFTEYIKRNVGATVQAWRLQNPVPAEAAKPN